MQNGFVHSAAHLSHLDQEQLLTEIRAVVSKAPLFTPAMPRTGKPLSVAMTNCGPLGWLTDKARGYRYEPNHPETGKPWPPIPERLLKLWDELAACPAPPEACLVNYYAPGTKMGQHIDRDEKTFEAPVISVSLGADAWFRIGGKTRKDPTERILLKSGDVLVMAGESRLAYHGIDRILPGTSDLLKDGGRINLTLRRVNPLTRPE